MALNINTFRTRTITALIFVAVMLSGLLWNAWSFIILFTVIHFGCWYEFVKLMKKIYQEKFLLYSFLGIIYITVPMVAMLDLPIATNLPTAGNIETAIFSTTIPCIIIFSIWINDTMAYLVGSFIGKTPFSKISPKKTWEGTIGGAILCVVTISLFAYFSKWLPVVDAMAISAICAFFGTEGDLLESKIKRMADVKDSGSIMPGHGGFLDRFDSLLVATPFVWLFVKLFM
jgi:phosphatidate cytidylyltransferase